MFESKTLFVVGAGASAEVGLPIGTQLKSIIASKIDIRFRDWNQISGDYRISEALRQHVEQNDGSRDINPYLHVGWRIRDAMPQAISIDNFLDAHRDPKMELCGKLAIAQSILEAERNSRLYVNRRQNEEFRPEKLNGTWYAEFFKMLTQGVRASDIDGIFENVSFIVFNYDRCIEYFLVNALRTYYLISEERAQELVSRLTIFHPYGLISQTHWQSREGVTFGAEANGARLLVMASQIKTFTERLEDNDAMQAFRKLVEKAETIVFLGFGFHEMNMELLQAVTPSRVKRVFATAWKSSSNDCSAIEIDILKMLSRKRQHVVIELSGDLTCTNLFETYWRSLPRRRS